MKEERYIDGEGKQLPVAYLAKKRTIPHLTLQQ